ncbi:MAG: SDR family oxidoreductase [Planctomycetaceae bacterium]|nr:SDR family oxidoreductase [Planctomycetaceae bacterium]
MKVIRGKTAVVTGAGSGLGRAIALRLANEGANVHLVDIDLPAAESVSAECRRLGVRAVAARCDLSQLGELEIAARDIHDQWGPIDILVNNAGIAWYGHTHKMPADAWERLLDVNLHAPIHLTRLLLPAMLKLPEAHVVNMASISGWVCSARFAAYHVSKFGLVGFSEAMRAEYLRRGVGFTAVCPGPVRTNLYKSAPNSYKGRETPQPPAWLCTTPERVAEATIRAIYRNRAVTFVSPMAWLLYYSKRLAPWIFHTLHHFGQKRQEEIKARREATRARHDNHRRAA